ncbi:MAG: radical SAM protein [Thioploca sp.]|nr:radical SAM protein [Thioploca sp.]
MSLDKKYDLIAMDITSNCNLRCPFCLNDYSQIKGNTFITDELFNKAMQLLPLTHDGLFFISCLFEPTIHTEFINFLEKIPLEYRKKVFFTTNLAKKLSDETLERLSCIKLHHINISLDSLNAELFEKLRKGAKLKVFIDNLERLTSHFSKNPDAPEIRYLTLVFKSNLKEIPELVEKCATQYLSSLHNIRPVWKVKTNADWLAEEYINANELEILKKQLAQFSYTYSVGPLHNENAFLHEKNYTYIVPPTAIRISSNGRVEFLEREVFINLNDIKEPYNFFKDMLSFLELDLSRANELQKMLKRVNDFSHPTTQPQHLSTFNFFRGKIRDNLLMGKVHKIINYMKK